jgi:hypothetical protein
MLWHLLWWLRRDEPLSQSSFAYWLQREHLELLPWGAAGPPRVRSFPSPTAADLVPPFRRPYAAEVALERAPAYRVH